MKKIILILVLFLSASWAQNLEINPDTGLIIDPDSPLVEANCLACHGSNLITNMHASRKSLVSSYKMDAR